MPSFSFVVRDSNVGEEAGLEREGAQEQLRGTGGGCSGQNLCDFDDQDTLPEWSKGVDSSSTSASCVGLKSHRRHISLFTACRGGCSAERRGAGAGGPGSEALLDPISPTPETQTAEVAFSALGGLIAFNASLA